MEKIKKVHDEFINWESLTEDVVKHAMKVFGEVLGALREMNVDDINSLVKISPLVTIVEHVLGKEDIQED